MTHGVFFVVADKGSLSRFFQLPLSFCMCGRNDGKWRFGIDEVGDDVVGLVNRGRDGERGRGLSTVNFAMLAPCLFELFTPAQDEDE